MLLRLLLLGLLAQLGWCDLSSSTVDRELTVHVDPGVEDCYYEPLLPGDIIDLDYQVVDGGSNNDLRIDFKLLRPSGIPLVADYRQRDNAHRHEIVEAGDYRICFDNTNSRFSSKIVFFNVIVEKKEAEEEPEERFPVFQEETYDASVEDIDSALKTIREQITKTRHYQDQIRAQEYRDRSVAERNFERVNYWSIVHVLVMVIAGTTQLFLVRSLFDEKSVLYGLWKKTGL